jgi:hypothetical protein
MKKLNKINNKNKNRSASLLNTTHSTKIYKNNKIKNYNKSFRHSSTIDNNLYNNKLNQKYRENSFRDLKIYQKQKMNNKRFNIRDIDIIKEKQNYDLLNKVTNYLEQKKEKISIVNKIKEPKLENLKKLLQESKSEQNILSKTFSTKFIGNDEYTVLSQVFGKGHGRKIGSKVKKNNDNDDEDSFFYKTKTNLFCKYNINPAITIKEKTLLNSIKIMKKKKINVHSSNNYYDNQYESFKALQINRNLYNQLILNQEKEQIKQFLKNELENEQQRLTIKLMPKIHTIELSKYKKDAPENNSVSGHRVIINSLSDLSKIPRNELFLEYNTVYLKTISKFLSTPTCRGGAKMVSYLDDYTNTYRILLFGGLNIIRLDDLWECTIFAPNKLDKKYIWKKVELNGEKPVARNGHSMVMFKDTLIIFGGIIEDKGTKIHEDLLCYDILEKKFSVEMCMNKFSVTWRSYHIAEMLGQYMFIYGGVDEKGNVLAEPWALDIDRMRWEPAKFSTEVLPKRKFHCSCQVFAPQKKYHSKFNLFKVYSEPGLFNSTKILVEGIYMFGGVDENLKCSNDVLIIKRGKPLQLFKAITKGVAPAPRCECSMDFFEKLDVVIIYGGRNDGSKYQPFFNDMFFLDVENLNWINIELNSNENFSPRSKHCSCIADNELIIFGGTNQKFLKSDLLVCNLDIGESSKLIRATKFFKVKNKIKKDKIDFLENEQIINNDNINLNNDNGIQMMGYSLGEENENGRMSIPLFEKAKNMQLNPPNKLKKDTKILMNQKLQTSKNFFLNFPEQKNQL